MKVLTCLVVLTILPTVDGILCRSHGTISEEGINSSMIDSFKHQIVENLKGKEQTTCEIAMFIRYSLRELEISFMEDLLAPRSLKRDSELEHQTDLQFRKNEVVPSSTLRYSCSTDDYCEIKFLFNHIHWFINDGYQENLIKKSLSLLTGTNLTLQNCYSSNGRTYKCSPDSTCAFTWSENNFEQGCRNDLKPGIYIVTQINLRTSKELQILSFGCNYDQCNSNETLQKLKSLVENHHDLTPMRQALNNNQSVEIAKITSTEPASEQIKLTTDKSSQTSDYHFRTKITSSMSDSIKFSLTSAEPTNSCSIHQSYLLIYFLTILCLNK